MKNWILLICSICLCSCKSTTPDVVSIETNNLPIDKASLIKHVEFLASDEQQGRKSNSPSIKRSAEYIVNNLADLGLDTLPNHDSYYSDFSYKNGFSNVAGQNIVGLIEGSTHKTSYIILTAHYDHIGIKGSHVFNGADDNASGVSALLELAKALKVFPPKHSVIFLFTDAEEVNLTGAKAFIQNNPGIAEQIKLNINLDMLAGDNRTKRLHYISKGLEELLPAEQQSNFEQIKKQSLISFRKGFNTAGLRTVMGKRNWRLASDHGAFYKQGIPFIYYGVGDHKNYHTPNDNLQNLNKNVLWLSSNTIYQHLVFIDKHI